VALFGWDDLVLTHISARVPGPGGEDTGEFLINPYGFMFEEITASSLVKVDAQGNKLDKSPFDVNPAGFTIRSALDGARHDAGCVLHVHSLHGIAVSAQRGGVLPLS
jgi:ribulose-5-phosphate 4-epimerase/fuculose-1-phosphate aldolase